MSAVEQSGHTEFVKYLEKHSGLKTLWTLRNDDIEINRISFKNMLNLFIKL